MLGTGYLQNLSIAYIFEAFSEFVIGVCLPQYLLSLIYFCFIMILLLFLVIIFSFPRVGNKSENEITT